MLREYQKGRAVVAASLATGLDGDVLAVGWSDRAIETGCVTERTLRELARAPGDVRCLKWSNRLERIAVAVGRAGSLWVVVYDASDGTVVSSAAVDTTRVVGQDAFASYQLSWRFDDCAVVLSTDHSCEAQTECAIIAVDTYDARSHYAPLCNAHFIGQNRLVANRAGEQGRTWAWSVLSDGTVQREYRIPGIRPVASDPLEGLALVSEAPIEWLLTTWPYVAVRAIGADGKSARIGRIRVGPAGSLSLIRR